MSFNSSYLCIIFLDKNVKKNNQFQDYFNRFSSIKNNYITTIHTCMIVSPQDAADISLVKMSENLKPILNP